MDTTVQARAIVAAAGNIRACLWYPMVVASVTVIVGGLRLRETRIADAHD